MEIDGVVGAFTTMIDADAVPLQALSLDPPIVDGRRYETFRL
jgi:hypothetical protein